MHPKGDIDNLIELLKRAANLSAQQTPNRGRQEGKMQLPFLCGAHRGTKA